MRLRALLFGFACLWTPQAFADPVPVRIVSLNLCTDQLLLALVPRERIAMLSSLAADPLLSWHAAQAGERRNVDTPRSRL